MVMPPYSHISDVGVCQDWGELRAGDRVKVVAYYDEYTHMQMRDAYGKTGASNGMNNPLIALCIGWRSHPYGGLTDYCYRLCYLASEPGSLLLIGYDVSVNWFKMAKKAPAGFELDD
jgi:hypothetical protein